ncbi:MAG: carotenoid biosynthesis protein [Chloroflexi bacterium]|nr:carotenoid biosynthesis protein [Chloroflexota bacterium]
MTLRRVTLLLLAAYAGLTLYILLRMALGLSSLAFTIPFLSLLAFTFALLHAGQRFGWSRTLLLLGLTFGVSLLFESVGVATGLVYGPYHYTDRLGPKFLGLVPYLIPVAWFMMMYPSFLMAQRLAPPRLHGIGWAVTVAGVGGLIMTAWDLIMDPLMVASGHWVWEVKGAYFGVPLQNYAGWWLTTFVTFLLFILLSRQRIESRISPEAEGMSFDRLALFSYLTTAAGNGFTALEAGLGGPALVGLFAMLPWVLLTWWRTAPEPAKSLKNYWF